MADLNLDGMKARAEAAAALKHNRGQFWMRQYVSPLAADVLALVMTLEATRDALHDAIASNTAWADEAKNYRELLESCWAHLDPYLLEDGTPHPGERSIIHELFERLWPERVKK